ncbi:MAG: hypothetical protein U0360_02670 [Dehalococcoidia bacterium]
MRTLAVYGWSDSTPALLEALRTRAELEAVAIGDERPAALARARTATGLAVFQHAREMARSARFDTLLLGAGEHAAEIAEVAAARGADLVAIGALASADVLSRASIAAHRFGVALTVLRPWLRDPALLEVGARLSFEPPALLLIDAAEPRPPMRLLRDLVAVATRVVGAPAIEVSASTLEDDESAPLTAHVRYASGRTVMLSARMALAPALRVLASSPERTLEARTISGCTVLEETPARSGVLPFAPVDRRAAVHREAARAVVAAEAESDAGFAPAEAALLGAIEHALAGSFAEPVQLAPRPFQLLRGGRSVTGPRAAGAGPALSVVGG